MRQYYEIKAENPGCILFFRMGDFFELFESDAEIASKILGITLTTRNNGLAEATPLCGFPHHASERYIPKMVAAGYKVAICEQIEDPKLAKGIVKRAVVEVVSAGTAMSEANLSAKESSFLCAVLPATKNQFAFALADVSTGFLAAALTSGAVFENEISCRMPKEIVLPAGATLPKPVMELAQAENILLTELPPKTFDEETAWGAVSRHFGAASPEVLGLGGRSFETRVTGACLAYLTDLKKSELSHITKLDLLDLGEYMSLDPSTLRNLEIVKPLNAEDFSSTLCSVLDRTVTAMGGRLLREWLLHPLLAPERIRAREAAVGELARSPILLDAVKKALSGVLDMERLMGRIGSGRANARDLAGMGRSLIQASNLSEALSGAEALPLKKLSQELAKAAGQGEWILSFLKDELPMTLREGGMIRPGASAELDRMNEEIKERREWLSSLEGRERERLGIPTLKVGYNRVFGYYIEVTNAQASKVPPEYIRKQTTKNSERYITPEMKECELIISSAEARINDEEYRIFCALRDKIEASRAELQGMATAVATADVFYSLASAAREFNYVCPEISEESGIEIKSGFHPVIVAANADLKFVPNDTTLSPEAVRLMLITGPNMAGKSTYLRQTGLIVLMAQVGSFVPAEAAKIGIVDKIFTRVGASDRLSRGLSTFMVEMMETANILRNATPKSLVLLDEIGRGTSTFDGLSIAWAILEALHDDPGIAALTLFATHYHELTSLAETLEHAANFQVGAREEGDKLVFLHKVVAGSCDSSYGIHVAEMAGVPPKVLRRARRILLRLEKQKVDPSDTKLEKDLRERPQIDIFEPPDENSKLLREELSRIRPEELTPLQAIQKLSELKEAYCK